MASRITGVFGNSEPFWDHFASVVPEAVRCDFLFTATEIVSARAQEYRRESGPYLPAVKTNHLPRALLRLDMLKKGLEVLGTFYEDDHSMVRAAGRIDEASKIIVDFQTQIVTPLDDAVKKGEEIHAQGVIESLKLVAGEIARSSENSFMSAVEELEEAVVRSVVYVGPLTGFVSCVSLDLAQYGAHARILHNFIEAPGVLELNRKIHREIETAIKAYSIPSEDFIKIDTGDGAILIFTTKEENGNAIVADRAYQFSKFFLNAIAGSNEGKDEDHQLHFRVGICSGMIAGEQSRIRCSDITHCRAGGVPLGTAVRLQTAAKTGEIVACAATWNGLSHEVRGQFGQEQQIHGKIHEKTPILAHRFECVPPRPEESDKPNLP